ncbi:Mitogen-activated protein kinase 19 [Spatholobus suberectus]|nr:Mitogen-activated protein kinase 19 [Spatholobus suberectus]
MQQDQLKKVVSFSMIDCPFVCRVCYGAEVKLLRLLRHPDIVEIKRIMLPPSKREFKDIYVVFELMESDLHQVIKANDDLTREHHQFFLYQMLRALKYMHTASVYHRDLKPKNILANANCKLKVCDFGLARVAFNDTPTTTFWTGGLDLSWKLILSVLQQLIYGALDAFCRGVDRKATVSCAIDQFRKQFAYLEENHGKSGPVIPPERKHVSLPRSTVHSSTVPPSTQPSFTSYENKQMVEEASKISRSVESNSGSQLRSSRPPPRVPAGNSGDSRNGFALKPIFEHTAAEVPMVPLLSTIIQNSL